jgi:formylglycine-generating enzyme required for sulfatase activity
VVRDRLSDRGQAAKIEPPRLPDPISKNEAIAEPGPQRPIDVVSTPSPPDLKDMAPPVTPEAQPDRPVPVSPPPRERITNSLGMILVRIEPGEFDMGTRPEQVDLLIQQFPEATPEWFDVERPSHRVRITRAFHLGAHEVTVGQFRRFVEASGYQTEAERNNEGSYVLDEKALKLDPQRNWRNPGFPQGDDHPVVCVSHHDALAFIQWLNHQHPEESRSYRLPTEAEWEYVCRAGTAGLYGASDDPESLARVANVADASFRKVFAEFSAIRGDDGFVYTAPVGSFTPNTWGAYDMLGNVWEWCQDGYAEDYYRNAPRDDPPGSLEASSRVYRGGCWYSHPRLCRPAIRYGFTPEFRFNDLGFRVALGSSN